METNFKIYEMGGSCCDKHVDRENQIFIKEIRKNVEGVANGFKKFYYEIKHMQKCKNHELFPKILFIIDTEEWYKVGMEYCYNGCTLLDLLRNSNVKMEYYKESVEFILESLFTNYYSIRKMSTPNMAYLDVCYFDRIVTRLNEIDKLDVTNNYHFSNTLSRMMREKIIINGEEYAPLKDYIEFLRNDLELREKLMIRHNTESHHDLCPLNILVDYKQSQEFIHDFRLIDPRGESETGIDVRNCMYDMGKFLLGLDLFDIFRIFNGKIEPKVYEFNLNREGTISISFSLKDGNIIAERYKVAYKEFWRFMDKKNYYSEIVDEDYCKLKYLFSFAMMYHSDIPCRILYEKDEEMALLMYMRGMMLIKEFLIYYYKKDILVD